MIKDYYKILGIVKTSSHKDIRIAFRKLAIFWHPEKNSNCIALSKIKEVNEAYMILSDSEKKIVYDKIYKDFFSKYNYISNKSTNYESNKDLHFEKKYQLDEYLNKKYKDEIESLEGWISKIRFSISDFDVFLDKSFHTFDEKIEFFFYYLPYLIWSGISLVLLISALQMSNFL